jgi:hypothetical protein
MESRQRMAKEAVRMMAKGETTSVDEQKVIVHKSERC